MENVTIHPINDWDPRAVHKIKQLLQIRQNVLQNNDFSVMQLRQGKRIKK
jgi:hypothetical protein